MFLPLITAIPKAVLCSVQNANPRKDTVTNYPSIEEAIKDILACAPQIIAFGEIHPDPGFTYKSTKARFAESVLPQLAASGIRDLVIEQILIDPSIEAEINLFYSTGCDINGKNTPTLANNINFIDRKDLIYMLKRCKELGIRIHAGGMSIAQANETTKHPNFSKKITLRDRARKYSGKAIQAKINQLLRLSPKLRFAVYGGLIHNNISDSSDFLNDGTNFGRNLSKRLRKRYFEVDLLPPQEKEMINNFGKVRDWEKLIPEKGAASVNRNQTRIIFFPETN